MARVLNVGYPPSHTTAVRFIGKQDEEESNKGFQQSPSPSSAAFSKLFYCSLNDSFPYHTFQPIRCGNGNFRFLMKYQEWWRSYVSWGKMAKWSLFFNSYTATIIFVRTHIVTMFVIIFAFVQQCTTTRGLKIMLKFLRYSGIFLCLKFISVIIFAFVQRCAATHGLKILLKF